MARWLKRTGLLGLLALLCCAAAAGAMWWRTRAEYPVAASQPPTGPLQPLPASGVLPPSDRSVVMLVFDGMAGSLIDAVDTPNLDRLAAEGAHTPAMRPVFPTLSLPNHFAMSTGCRPERSGVVSNRFIDPDRGLYSTPGDAHWLLDCEPLPVVAERQGVRTAIFGWVAATRDRAALASIVDEFREPPPSIEQRTAQVLNQLHAPQTTRPQLMVAYFTEPDQTLHFNGLGSSQAAAVMKRVDAAVGKVQRAIDELGLRERTTLIVTTDHGMIDVHKHLNLEGVLRRAGIAAKIAADGAIAHVYLEDPNTAQQAVDRLRGRSELEAFLPARQPPWAHLGHSTRLGDVVVVSKPGYYMFDRGLWPKNVRWFAPYGPDILAQSVLKASHGYPPDSPGMQSAFYAWGAGIVPGTTPSEMESVDVQPTIARLLSIAPGRPLDGRAHDEILSPAAPEARGPQPM